MCIRCEVKGEYINFFGEYDDPKESSKNMLIIVFWPIYLVFYIIKGTWWFISHLFLSFGIILTPFLSEVITIKDDKNSKTR